MANIDVRINQLKKNATNEKNIAKKIQKIAQEIEDIAGNLPIQSSVTQKVRSNLRTVSSNVNSNAEKVRILGQSVEEIASIYQKTEREVSNKKGTKEKIADAIDRIKDMLRDIAGILGMDTACCYSGDPVNLSNGNYVYEKTIFNFETVIPMNLRFFYNIQGEDAGALGKGWMHNFERRLQRMTDRVYVLSEDGTLEGFMQVGDEFKPVEGTNGCLVQNDEEYFYEDEEQIGYYFSYTGLLQKIRTRDGWEVLLEYDNQKLVSAVCTDKIGLYFSYEGDYLAEVSDHTGRKVCLDYKKGQLAGITDPEGNVTQYRYCKEGNLIEVIGPDGNLALKNEYDSRKRTIRQDFPDGGVIFYDYDDDNKAVIMTRQNGSKVVYYHDNHFRSTKTVYPDGEELIEYNNNHQRTAFTDKAGYVTKYAYNYAGKMVRVVNPLGDNMEFQYNEAGLMTHLFVNGEVYQSSEYDEKNHQISSTDANQVSVYYTYDEQGRLVETRHEDGSLTRLTYDECGNIIFVEDPRTGNTKYEYDECHRVVRTIDALGNATEYKYNKNDLITKVLRADGSTREYTYDKKGNVISVKDFNGGVMYMKYNAMNKPVMITDADGNSTEFEYDTMWNPVKKKMPDGAVFQYGYDSEGRMNQIQDPLGNVETAEYDAVGNLIKRVAADGGEYQMKYDALRRVVEKISPTGGSKKFFYDVLGNLTEVLHEDGSKEVYTYDAVGNRMTFTDQNGYTRYFSYDDLRNLTEVRDEKGILAKYEYLPGGYLAKETKTDLSTVEYCYNALGNVIEINDEVNGKWNFEYDSLGNVVSVKHGDSVEKYTYDGLGNITSITDGCGNKMEYEYTPAGALALVRDAKGVETGYEYDACYRMKRMIQPENGKFDAHTLNVFNKQQKNFRITEYTYDLCGNVLAATMPDGSCINYTYDACGRVQTKTDEEGNTITCSYDLDGMERSIAFGDGRSIKYQYDELRQLASIEDWLGITTFKRDSRGRLLETKDHVDRTVSHVWSDRGECKEIIYPDGRNVSYEYNEKGQLTSCFTGNEACVYTYYPNGQLKERQIGDLFCTKYAYDELGRIRGLENYKAGTLIDEYNYTYNAAGRKNQIREVHNHTDLLSGVYKYTYNETGSLKTVEKDGQLYQNFEYDIWGNRTKSYEDGVETHFEYDCNGRMISSISGGDHCVYSYDRRGNLREKTINGVQKLSLHFDALNRLSEAVATDVKTTYQYNGMDMLVGRSFQRATGEKTETFAYDYAKDSHNLLQISANGGNQNVVWDMGLFATISEQGNQYYLNDERMNQTGVISENTLIARRTFDAFGQVKSTTGNAGHENDFLFSGFQMDPVTGFYHANKRQYDAKAGRFISCDPIAGALMVPLTLNAYAYCMSDPINHYDPTGMIAVWLASGIVGAVANVGGRLAGDVISSIAAGKWQGSSVEDYIGSAAGGFVQGSVLIAAGPEAAGAAGAATEAFVSGGLKMATGKEEFSATKLIGDTAIAAGKGAITGFAYNWGAKYLKISKITKGKGSALSVWKQVTTKAQKGIIQNVSASTLWKGLLVHGPVRIFDTMLVKGKEKFDEWAKETAKDLFDGVTTSITRFFPGKQNATCPAAGV